MPMLRALVPLAAGIVMADYYTLPAAFVWAGFVLSGIAALTLRSSLYTAMALLLFGWGLSELRTLPPDELPRSVRTEFSLTTGDDASATVTAWRDAEQGVWRKADVQVVVRTDSTLELGSSERILFRGYLNDFPEKFPAYSSLMRRRGYAGSVWLSERSILSREQAQGRSLHTAAAERLHRLGLPEKERALCLAMAVGDRSGITRELRAAYTRSGTSHLLAVSGLHVGIVFLLVNVLLWWLPVFRRGHLLRNIVAIVLIWLYAVTAGLSPSVVRAALMFSVLQLSLASASAYVSGNALAGTALVMLLFRPSYLFDISFQLSFIAVAAILAWGVPLCRVLHTRYRPLNALADTLAVGVTAAVATAPLVAHTFGIVSLAGIAVNVLVIPLATIAVLGSVVWIVLPVPLFAPLLRLITGTAAAWQNRVAEWAAALPWAAFEVTLTSGQTAVIYLLLVVITGTAWCRKPKKSVPLHQ